MSKEVNEEDGKARSRRRRRINPAADKSIQHKLLMSGIIACFHGDSTAERSLFSECEMVKDGRRLWRRW